MSPSTTTKTNNKHHHHGDGSGCPSSGMDSMIPCLPSGGQPCAYIVRGRCQRILIDSSCNHSKREIILAATSHGEQCVYLDRDVISDNEESILKVFTGQMHAVDITNVYQYAPVINDIKFLKETSHQRNWKRKNMMMNTLAKHIQSKEMMMTNPREVLSV